MRLAVFLLLSWITVATAGSAPAYESAWRALEPGLEMVRFDTLTREQAPDGDLVVLRVDPQRWRVRVLGPGPETGNRSLDLRQWCRRFDLVAAINAGMYQADFRTHVGYCKLDGEVINPSTNDYLSVMACDPVRPHDPPFRLFDLDEITLREIGARYRTVVQNLRLIKRPRENRWQPQGDRWAEAALGEDSQGRALLIHCASPRSMFEFNRIVLELPIDLVAAQHLEGRGQARLWIEGVYDEGAAPILPNIIGIAPRRTGDE